MPPTEIFNPNEFTETELVKLIYRDLTKLRAEFDEFRKNDTHQKELAEVKQRLASLELKGAIEAQLKEEKEKTMKKYVAIGGVVLTAVNAIVSWLVKNF